MVQTTGELLGYVWPPPQAPPNRSATRRRSEGGRAGVPARRTAGVGMDQIVSSSPKEYHVGMPHFR